MSSRIVTIDLSEPFDLVETLDSGQVFHWRPHRFGEIDGFAGTIGDSPPLWIAQKCEKSVWTLPGREPEAVDYFGLDHSLSAIHETFPVNDPFLAEAISFCPGLRLVRQPIWECLATFITSSLKQIAQIRSISLTLREKFGDAHQWDGETWHCYPPPQALRVAGEEALRQCALGYRAKSLHLAGCALSENPDCLENLSNMTADQAVRELTRFHGVGEKIAHCALLFGSGRWEMFPIDVWIERVLRKAYRKRIKGAKLQKWAGRHFGPNAGYAQQYLFHFARKSVNVSDWMTK